VRLLVILCGSGLLAIVVLYSVGTHMMVARGEEFQGACERYLERVQAGEYHQAYAELGRSMQERVSEDDYRRGEEHKRNRLGGLQSRRTIFADRGTDEYGNWGRIKYSCRFDKGRGSLRFDLRREDGDWKIVATDVDSTLLIPADNPH
jgi:hypothetical protein